MDNQYYNQNYQPTPTPPPPPPPPQKQSNGAATASLICGIICYFCCNPFYLLSLTAIVLGIIGMSGDKPNKGMAVAGMILGVVSIAVCVIVDICLLPITFGLSFLI
ncbi:MAG: DUF4190 domain-containing protein [Clostridia bacterium]|nr:DUF4190 domain-containing protein [Clostridia bacterium]